MVTTEGNGTINTIFILKYLNGNIRRPQTVVNYNFMEGVINEEEEILFLSKPNLFSIGMIILFDQMVAKPQIQFKHELGMVVVDETLTMEKLKIFRIAEWILFQDIQV